MGIAKKIRKWQTKRASKSAFRAEFEQFAARAKAAGSRLSVEWEDRYPCLDDRTGQTGFDRHYIYHTAWAARVLARTRPARHVDISSSLYFAALVSAFVPVDFYDYRPADLKLDNLASRQADLMQLPFADGDVKSLSCMHVVEHVGLARYGDAMDVDGDLKAVAELGRVLAPGGDLLFVVPVGKPRVQFNAHRIYSYAQVLGFFPGLQLVEYALIPDKAEQGHLVIGASEALTDSQKYACGCFWFRRPM